MRRVVVVPAYNEERTVGDVVRSLIRFADRVIVVDDGSTDGSAALAAAAGADVVSHLMNRGLGAALGTGISAALADNADIIVTFDADGQHRAEDVARLVAPLEAGAADAAIGCRTLERNGMPVSRRTANWIGNALTAALFGTWVSDSQSGLRAFTRAAAERLDLTTDRMEVSSEIIREVGRLGLRLAEVSIRPIYTDYSLSKGQGFVVGLKTAGRLVVKRVLQK
ncbi:glycosyltransferase family 2 protein [Candidatus Uhrbacteria bacterium]|nr:glycosyltransferase family 2 protein [Candidatus Uhrbacteria bacterium]